MITLSSLQALPSQSVSAASFWKPALAVGKCSLASSAALPLRWSSSSNSKNQQCQIKRPRTRPNFELGRRIKLKHGVMARALETPERKVQWLLEPVGDGDSRHLREKVPIPGAFELASDAVVVGRLSSKSDVVIPVATVSALHARLEKKDGSLFVTDLGSTNGTYIDRKKLKPGAVTPVFPGSYITFGDEHLAAFRFSKLEQPDAAPDAAEAVEVLESPIQGDQLSSS